jgi:hypothetical protein
MKTLRFALLLLAFHSVCAAEDAPMQTITLKDKSVIRAQVTEISGGYYRLKSPVLGEMQIPTAGVISIQPDAAPAQPSNTPTSDNLTIGPSAATQPSPAQQDINSLQSTLTSKVQNLVSTKEGLNAVMAFSGNKDVKAVMNDPQVMKAIQNGDYQALMKSPAMKQLIDNPQTKALIQSVLSPAPQSTPQARSTPNGN